MSSFPLLYSRFWIQRNPSFRLLATYGYKVQVYDAISSIARWGVEEMNSGLSKDISAKGDAENRWAICALFSMFNFFAYNRYPKRKSLLKMKDYSVSTENEFRIKLFWAVNIDMFLSFLWRHRKYLFYFRFLYYYYHYYLAYGRSLTIEAIHYLDGWRLCNTGYCELGCTGGVKSEWEIGELGSNSRWICYIHLRTNTFFVK